jgi:uncharacterized transporter YbjL
MAILPGLLPIPFPGVGSSSLGLAGRPLVAARILGVQIALGVLART